jgi:hypothetical protein
MGDPALFEFACEECALTWVGAGLVNGDFYLVEPVEGACPRCGEYAPRPELLVSSPE